MEEWIRGQLGWGGPGGAVSRLQGRGCGSGYGVEWVGLEHVCWREPLELADGQDVGNEEKHNPQLSGINSWMGSNDIY